MDLISIIVPVYKVEKYLSECIDSILAQTYENFELILVDDGSPDNSGKICDEYASKDNRIKVIHKENGGVSSARNMGLDNASGEYITFIDSDDFVDKQYLELMYNKLIETESDMCFCRFDRYNGNSFEEKEETIPESLVVDHNNLELKEFINSYFVFGKHMIGSVCWRTLYKAEKAKSNYFNESLTVAEDLIYILKCILNSNSICSIPNNLYHFRNNDGSLTHTYRKSALKKALILKDEILNLDFNFSKEVLNAYFLCMCYSLLLNELKFKQKDRRKSIKQIRKSELYRYFKLINILKIKSKKTMLKNTVVWVIVKFRLY